MASSDEDERDDFVVLGKALPEITDEESKRPTNVQDLTARDKQGRRRFHGAFTGGFSAGYFNTVGTKEGFTPSTFVSSKKRKPEDGDEARFRASMPEDFMDEEDLEEHGIAPRKFATAGSFTSEERRRKRLADSKQIAGTSTLDVGGFLGSLEVSDQLTVGIKLLRKMGWKEGQGLGPRLMQKKKRKKPSKSKAGQKTYGCALPPSDSDQESEEEFVPESMSSVTFAPKDVTPIPLAPKDNLHGLGYRGLDPSLALPGSHINLFSDPVRSKAGRKGISGHAFGVGAFEDDDDDIYAVDSMSNYDVTMQAEEGGDNKYGWTAPRQHGKQSVPVSYVGKLLEGFCLSKKQLKPKKKFPPPELPRGFKPHHWFRKQRLESHIPEHLRERADNSTTHKSNMTAIDRGMLLGETPVMGSVFDLIPKDDRARIDATKEAIGLTKSLRESQTTITTPITPHVTQNQEPSTPSSMANSFLSKFTPASLSGSTGDKQTGSDERAGDTTPKTPLFQGSLSFQPFRKNPDKQKRYDSYLSLLKQGVQDPYNTVTSPQMTEWERARERDEFSKAAKMYRPLSAMMSSRFVSGSMIDDEAMGTPLEAGLSSAVEAGDEVKAAEMKMFGKLTREEFEWHPHQLLCKRFNIANPYPGSDVVGVPGVKRDKYSVFDFLSMSDFQSGSTQEPSTTRQTIDEDDVKEKTMTPNRKKATMASIFKVLDDPNFHKPSTHETPGNPNSNQPSSTHSQQQNMAATQSQNDATINAEEENDEEPSVEPDLFRAIFKNSDSEDSDDDDEKEKEKEDGGVDSSDSEGDKGQDSAGSGRDSGGLAGRLEAAATDDVVVVSRTGGERRQQGEDVGGSVDVKLEPAELDGGVHHPFQNLFKRKKVSSDIDLVPAAEETQPKSAQSVNSTNGEAGTESGHTSTAAEKHRPTPTASREWKSRWGGTSVFSILDEVTSNTQESEVNSRLAPPSEETEGNNQDGGSELYGPRLPPQPSAEAATGATVADSRDRGRPTDRRHRKESRSSHRKEKKKKSKHKKEKKHRKHKKSSKSRSKSRKRHSSSTGSDADSESESGESVSDSELLDRLREVSRGNTSFKR